MKKLFVTNSFNFMQILCKFNLILCKFYANSVLKFMKNETKRCADGEIRSPDEGVFQTNSWSRCLLIFLTKTFQNQSRTQ